MAVLSTIRKAQRSARPQYGTVARRVWCAGLLAIVLAPTFVGQTTRAVTEYQVKAAFLYNFARFVEWPPEAFSSATDPLKVCIWGDDPFGRDIDELIRGKLAQQRRLQLERVSSATTARTCHLVFMSRAPRAEIQHALEQLRGSPVLTVGEGPDFLRDGGVMNLVLQDDRVRFEVNLEAAQRARLRISAKLLSVARNVYDGVP